MRGTELLRLVWLNLIQNKFKTIMTSIGIVVGAATIVMVIAIGRGGQMDVAEQFSSLNAGAIDITYEYEGEEESGGFMSGGFGNFLSGIFGGGMRGGSDSSASAMPGMSGGFSGGMPSMGNMPGMGGSTDGNASGGMPSMGNMPGMGGSSDSGDSGGMPDMGNMPDMSGGFQGRDGSDDSGENSGRDFPGGSDMAEEFQERMQQEGFGDQEGSDAAGDRSFGRNRDENTAGEAGDGQSQEAGSGQDGDMSANREADEQESGEMETEDAVGAEDENAAAGDSDEEETEESLVADRMNQENIILSIDDVEDIELFVSGITGVTISYSSRGSVEGGNLTDAQTYTIAGAKESYASVSNLEFAAGEFLTDWDDDAKARVCVLGSSAAKEIFGSADAAYESTIYIDDRTYTVIGVLETTGTVSGGISPDDAIFVPYETGIKYITGENISPTITVIAQDVNVLDSVIEQVETVLAENYNNAEFTFADAGSKMEAAESSNRILTMLLSAMAVIVFIVGGIGIMNVLFVSVKERTSEIGILKSLGASRKTILLEFLLESAAISLIGGILGVGVSFAITPLVEMYDIRVEATMTAWAAALGFAVLTGTLFGFYPALKASRLVPVEALNAE